jgi:hypothetical protein
VRELERGALRGGVNQVFAIGRYLYGPSLKLEALSGGYPVALKDGDISQLEDEVAPFSVELANKLEDVSLCLG